MLKSVVADVASRKRHAVKRHKANGTGANGSEGKRRGPCRYSNMCKNDATKHNKRKIATCTCMCIVNNASDSTCLYKYTRPSMTSFWLASLETRSCNKCCLRVQTSQNSTSPTIRFRSEVLFLWNDPSATLWTVLTQSSLQSSLLCLPSQHASIFTFG